MDYQKIVQDILDRAVDRGQECGCQAALFIDGKLEVNAYAGYTDWTRSQKVDENTVFPVYSTGKAPSSTLIHRLVEKGLVKYDTPIREFWPEFAACGKEDMRVWHVLTYRSALFNVPESTPEELADFKTMTAKMAASAPAYQFGTKQQYHPRTYGWLTGGIACHLLNREDYYQIFREQVGIPAGMDRYFYGISPDEKNAAYLVSAQDGSNYSQEHVDRMNNPLFRCCCNPSSCAMSNALSIAKHYAALDTCSLLSKETLDNAVRPWRAADDAIPLVKGRWELFGLGYVLSGPVDNVSQIFGHGGIGGSEGLCDRKRHYALGITRNVFASPNVIGEFYAAVDFKNRDWPDPAEMPSELKPKN